MDCCDVLCGIVTCCCEFSAFRNVGIEISSRHAKRCARYVVCKGIPTFFDLTDTFVVVRTIHLQLLFEEES